MGLAGWSRRRRVAGALYARVLNQRLTVPLSPRLLAYSLTRLLVYSLTRLLAPLFTVYRLLSTVFHDLHFLMLVLLCYTFKRLDANQR